MYRTIETSIWSDPAFKALPPNGKLLFVYLITNPHTHVSGIYYIPTVLMVVETGISDEELDTLWDTLSSVGLSRRDSKTDVIWVVNMFKYQGVGEKNHRSAANHLSSLHKSFLIKDFLTRYPQVRKFYKDRVSHTPSRVGTQEQEQEQKINTSAEVSADAAPKAKPRIKATGPHPAFIDHFVTRWQDQYGAKYVVQPKDGVAAAKVLKMAGSLEKACELADQFLASADKFLAEQKHPLPMLVNQINRFLANAGKPGANGGGGDPDKFVPVHPDVTDLPWNRRDE
jgi:hypothetical protein